MIVMKFGGTSVADAERIRAVAAIVQNRLARRPIVVVSALAGVTDLLVRAEGAARAGDREGIEPALADLERRHRWAVAGTLEDAGHRHDVSLVVDGLFEELRALLRSIRLLGEGSSRSTDVILAFGETLAARIVVAAFAERGLPARWVDPREVIVTDDRHGAAEADLEATTERCKSRLAPLLEEGRLPVIGGFVGTSRAGRTTTLGRGGSDTSAAVIGSALDAEEIQIWTDVDGLMTADPRLVPAARTLPRVSFEEAAELAFYGAKVLHPASIAPAVRRQIPVRVVNAQRPDGEGTVIVGSWEKGAPALASIASRGGLAVLRATSRRMQPGPAALTRWNSWLESQGAKPVVALRGELGGVCVVLSAIPLSPLPRDIEADLVVERQDGRAVVCAVGSALAEDAAIRRRVLDALAELGSEIVSLGATGTSVTAVLAEDHLREAVCWLHRRFFEEDVAS